MHALLQLKNARVIVLLTAFLNTNQEIGLNHVSIVAPCILSHVAKSFIILTISIVGLSEIFGIGESYEYP